MANWMNDWEDNQDERFDSTPDYTITRVNGEIKFIKIGQKTYDILKCVNFLFFKVDGQIYILLDSRQTNIYRLDFFNGAYLTFKGTLSSQQNTISTQTGHYELHYHGVTPNSQFFIVTLTNGLFQRDLLGQINEPKGYEYYQEFISPKTPEIVSQNNIRKDAEESLGNSTLVVQRALFEM